MTCSPGSGLLSNLKFLGFVSSPCGEDKQYLCKWKLCAIVGFAEASSCILAFCWPRNSKQGLTWRPGQSTKAGSALCSKSGALPKDCVQGQC